MSALTVTTRPRPNRHERRRRKALGRQLYARLLKAARKGDPEAREALGLTPAPATEPDSRSDQ